VRGKLVPQDPKDEPASELLKRIAKEKTRLVKAGQIKAPNPSSISDPDKLHRELPFNWQWVPFGETINSHLGGGTPSKNNSTYWDGEILWASVKDVGKGKYLDETIDRITEAGLDDSSSNLIPPGNLIVVTRMGLGKVSINRVPIAINQDLRALSLSSLMAIDYCYFFFKTHGFEGTGLTVKGIKIDELLCIPFPLPPLVEQHRIVAKVDELMALCDRLAAARAEREAVRDRLAAASLARLNTPDPVTFQDDARFALDTLPALTARPDQIKHLRQTILNLAVRGKLVPQDPKDEPASELLKRIAAGKTDRKRKTGDARIKVEPDPNPDQLPLALPSGWSVQSFENLFLFIDYRGNTPPKTDGGIPLITAKNIRMGYLNRDPREYISEKTYKTWMTRGFPKIGDLFFTTEAPLANVCLNDINEPFALAQRAICFQPYAKIDTKFLMFALMSDLMQSFIDANATGMTAKGIKAANLKPLPIPFPPLAEQHRIVAKVDELMAMCDRLEASLDAAAATRRRLLDALLAEALAPAEARDREAAE
jgi:type I restriction enzyme, S subunit